MADIAFGLISLNACMAEGLVPSCVAHQLCKNLHMGRMWFTCCRFAKAGEGSLETAAVQHLLGQALKALGGDRLQDATAAFAACLATRERILGPQHPDTAAALLGARPSSQTAALNSPAVCIAWGQLLSTLRASLLLGTSKHMAAMP
jgi:hypothetical protein